MPHRRLLLKLEHYGVRDPLLSWIGDFLAERTQKVTLEGTTSKEAAVTSSVPQGTVLGSLLFLVYINDLPACVSSEACLFADDCLLYRTIKSQRDADILQDDLNSLQQWEAKWLMSFNPDKCEVLRVTNKRKNIIQSQYTIHGTVLNTVDKTKYLGVTIRSKLNWKPHISNISKKANNIRAFLHRHLTRRPAPIKEQAYKTCVRPILEYASTCQRTRSPTRDGAEESCQIRCIQLSPQTQCHHNTHSAPMANSTRAPCSQQSNFVISHPSATCSHPGHPILYHLLQQSNLWPSSETATTSLLHQHLPAFLFP